MCIRDSYGTNYHVACASPGQSSQAAIEALVTGWFQWAGAPIELHTDAGTEFTSREFSSMLTQFSVRSIVAAPGAHWQIGKVERHGHILQTMLRKYEQAFPHCVVSGPSSCVSTVHIIKERIES